MRFSVIFFFNLSYIEYLIVYRKNCIQYLLENENKRMSIILIFTIFIFFIFLELDKLE